MSTTRTIQVLEAIAEDMRFNVRQSVLIGDYQTFIHAPSFVRRSWFMMWEYHEWELMEICGNISFNGFDVRMLK